MPFSDNDLKRLKESSLLDPEIELISRAKMLIALIARLEAAEKAINPRCAIFCGNCECKTTHDAWKASKGAAGK